MAGVAEKQEIVTDDAIITITSDDPEAVRVDPATGNTEVEQDDGGVVVQFTGLDAVKAAEETSENFYRNLCDEIGEGHLGTIAELLIEQIEADDVSRSQAVQDRAKAMDLLGIKLEAPRSGADSAGGDGATATVTNPLLLENVLHGWATAVGELLPAEGPAKFTNETDETESEGDDQLAEALERDLNFYLTTIAPEWAPDTSQMLLWGPYLGGAGFKKVYVCPLRRRPVSDAIDMKDLIVSDTTKDLGACERITHQSPVRPSVMKRLMLKKFYRDVVLPQPSAPQPNAVDEKTASIQGTQSSANQQRRPEDQPYTIWESQCELDLDAFAPKEFKGKGIPLPYVVTIDKDSRTVLAIRRDWKPDDEDAARKRMYVKYPYVPGPGFYGTGLANILGNATAAMTAAWRISLDTAMFANFPGGLISKIGNRQLSSVLRPAAGEFVPVETGGGPIQEAIMALPYKDVTAGMMSLMDKILAQAKSVGTAADVPVGEGVQNVPVGTMLAHVEQATKIQSAAHKGMCRAMGEELGLLTDLFREDPESFWRGNKRYRSFWSQEKLFMALDRYNLVPKADPNVPSHVHRLMKATVVAQLCDSPSFGPLMDKRAALTRILSSAKIDAGGLMLPPPAPDAPPPPPTPEELTAQAKLKDANTKEKKADADIASEGADNQLKRDQMEFGLKKEGAELARAMVVHTSDDAHQERKHALDETKVAIQAGKAQADATIGLLKATKPDKPKGVS